MARPTSGRLLGRGALSGAAAVAASYLVVRSGRAERLDARAAAAVSRPLGSTADRLIGAATDLGSIYGLAGVAGALRLAGHRRLATDVAVSGLTAWCVAQGAKPLLPRDRPYVAATAARLVAEPAGTSWPSGHAAVVAAMASTVAPASGPVTRAGLAAAAVGVGVSRLYVGVHHASDLVAGAGVGVLSAALVRSLRRRG